MASWFVDGKKVNEKELIDLAKSTDNYFDDNYPQLAAMAAVVLRRHGKKVTKK